MVSNYLCNSMLISVMENITAVKWNRMIRNEIRNVKWIENKFQK